MSIVEAVPFPAWLIPPFVVLASLGVFLATGFVVKRCDFFMIPQAGPTKVFDVGMNTCCILSFLESWGFMLWDVIFMEDILMGGSGQVLGDGFC